MDTPVPRFELRWVVGRAAFVRLAAALELQVGRSRGTRVQSLLLAPHGAWREGGSAPAREACLELEEPAGGSPSWHARVRHRLGRRASVHEAEIPAVAALAAARGEAWPSVDDGADRVLSEVRALVTWESHAARCVVSRERHVFRAADGSFEALLDARLRCRDALLAPAAGRAGAGIRLLEPGEHLVEVRVQRALPWWLGVLLRRLDAVRRAPSDRELAWHALGLGGSRDTEDAATA